MKAYNPLYLQLKDYYQDKNGDVLEIETVKELDVLLKEHKRKKYYSFIKTKELL